MEPHIDIRYRAAHIIAQLKPVSDGVTSNSRDVWLALTLARHEIEAAMRVLSKQQFH
jgi:hypothetical protein